MIRFLIILFIFINFTAHSSGDIQKHISGKIRIDDQGENVEFSIDKNSLEKGNLQIGAKIFTKNEFSKNMINIDFSNWYRHLEEGDFVIIAKTSVFINKNIDFFNLDTMKSNSYLKRSIPEAEIKFLKNNTIQTKTSVRGIGDVSTQLNFIDYDRDEGGNSRRDHVTDILSNTLDAFEYLPHKTIEVYGNPDKGAYGNRTINRYYDLRSIYGSGVLHISLKFIFVKTSDMDFFAKNALRFFQGKILSSIKEGTRKSLENIRFL